MFGGIAKFGGNVARIAHHVALPPRRCAPASNRVACRFFCAQATVSPETRNREARKMAITGAGEAAITPRPVPKSAQEYEAARRVYNEQVSVLRKLYKSQWEARREVEAAEVKEQRRRVMLRKAENTRLKAIRRRKTAERHKRTRQRVNATAQADRNYRLAARRAYNDKVRGFRLAWLAKLEADSSSWIPEDKIDEMIGEDTFAMTYPWHLEEWYARRHRRRQLQAARARGETIDDQARARGPQDDAVVELLPEKEQLLKRGTGGNDEAQANVIELLAGHEASFIEDRPEHGRTAVDNMYHGDWESDDDMLAGFGSDWEEDVPQSNWWSKAERSRATGIQLEELYFQQSLVDIKQRLEQFEAAHDAKYPAPDASAADWADMAVELQEGHVSEPAQLLALEEELLAPHAAEAAERERWAKELGSDGEGGDGNANAEESGGEGGQ